MGTVNPVLQIICSGWRRDLLKKAAILDQKEKKTFHVAYRVYMWLHVAACGVRYGWGLHPTPGKIFILGALNTLWAQNTRKHTSRVQRKSFLQLAIRAS